MLRRFSLKFTKGRQEGPNGTSNEAEKPELGRKRSSFIPQRKEKEREKLKERTDQSANRANVESSFQKFAQLIHASNRPLPTQSGDGTYIEHTEPSGLMQDLRSIGFKDVGTLLQVMKSKTSGQLQDDKTYLMEYVIQVRPPSAR
jgi:linoleate 10R-lipoxygenase